MKCRVVLALIAVLALLVGGGVALSNFTDDGEVGLAQLRVRNMTCGSCVRNIEQALEDVTGVAAVKVSVTSGRARVEYAPGAVVPEAIAERISAAGYPAEVDYLLTPTELRNMKEDESRLSAKFIARVGERLVPREQFARMVRQRQKQMGAKVDQAILYKAVWNDLLPREIVLGASERSGVVVSDAEADLEYQRMSSASEGFAVFVVSRYGSDEAFKERLKEDLIINRNIGENVLSGNEDAKGRQAVLDRWYQEQARATEVVIFDPVLKAAVEGSGGGCGGSCC